jgi:hypothetical protein
VPSVAEGGVRDKRWRSRKYWISPPSAEGGHAALKLPNPVPAIKLAPAFRDFAFHPAAFVAAHQWLPDFSCVYFV